MSKPNSKNEHFNKNYNIMKQLINKYRNSPTYTHLAFELRRSKTTDSIYLSVSTILNGKLIKKTVRWSDHPGNTSIQRGANPRRKNKNNKLEKQIKSAIKKVERIRLRKLLNKKE